MVCSFSVHCGQCRREDVSVQLMWNSEGQSRSYSSNSLPTPRLGFCNLGNGSAGQRWNIISSVSRGSTSAWSCKGFFLTLAIWCKRWWYQAAGCWQGAVTSPSLLRGKELKMTSHQTITDINTFVKSRNTQRFYKILSRHWSTLTKRNHLSTSLIRQGKKIYHLTANNTWKMSLLCVISLMSEGDKAHYVHVFHTFSQTDCWIIMFSLF